MPECFISDGGPQYVSFVFKQFAQSHGFQYIVQTIKMMLEKSDDPYIALLSYRATPLANGHSPAELLMGKKLQTLLPIAPKQLKPKLSNLRSLRENEKKSKLKHKRNYDRRHRACLLTKVKTNDKVWIKDQKKSRTVKTGSNEPRSYIIQTDRCEIRRNRRHLVKIPESVKDNDKITSETVPDNSSKSDNEIKDIPDNLSYQTDYYVTRSGRISKPTDKLKE
jgi:hypothetical protein